MATQHRDDLVQKVNYGRHAARYGHEVELCAVRLEVRAVEQTQQRYANSCVEGEHRCCDERGYAGYGKYDEIEALSVARI